MNGDSKEKQTRNFKVLLELSRVDVDVRTKEVLETISQYTIATDICEACRVTNIPSYSSVYKRKR